MTDYANLSCFHCFKDNKVCVPGKSPQDPCEGCTAKKGGRKSDCNRGGRGK